MGEFGLEGSRAEYDFVCIKDVMVSMRDGIRLATDIYRPATDGRMIEGNFPAIVIRTPYSKDQSRWSAIAEYFARRGYVFVLQDVRARFKSEGDAWYPAVYEANDGYDTVEWIADQPWSNGKIGATGTSYMATVVAAMAAKNPPHLRCMWLNQGPWNAGHYDMRHAGAVENMTYPLFMAIDSKRTLGDPVVRAALLKMGKMSEWITRWPWRKGETPLALVPDYEQAYLDRVSNANSSDYPWMEPGYNSEAHFDDFADIPSVFSSSWLERYPRAVLEGFFSHFVKMKKSPCIAVVGTWLHGEDLSSTFSGDVDFGPAASFDLNAMRLKWFDHWLKGIRTDILDKSPIWIFRMGGGSGRKNKDGRMMHGGEWKYAKEWPLAGTAFTKYYLHGEGSLSTDRPTVESSSTTYQFDPDNPVPTLGGTSTVINDILSDGSRITLQSVGAQDQIEREGVLGCKPPYLPLRTRPDVLLFSTPPLRQAMEVTGPITVNLWASSSCVDTDFAARLIDIHPPNEDYPMGYHMNLTGGGIIRARYRDSLEKAELLEPGRIYEFTIIPYPTSNLFTVGHQISLYISSSNYPEFDVNPNTGEPLGKHRMKKVAENTIYHDAEHPSHIMLPIVLDSQENSRKSRVTP